MPADLLINPVHRQDVIVANDRNDDDLAPFDLDLELLANPQAYDNPYEDAFHYQILRAGIRNDKRGK